MNNTTRRHPRTLQEGDTFGRLTVIGDAPHYVRPSGVRESAVMVRCTCGGIRAVRVYALKSGATASCGCVQREVAAASNAAVTHGQSRSALYYVWNSMKQRCTNPSNKSWQRYGGRGIRVCEKWMNSFEAFLSDVGPRPEGATLDRYPNGDGHYETGNVRWATYSQQARNTSRNHMHTIGGETRCLAEWCELLGEPWTTVKKRVAAGRDPFMRQRKRRSQ